MSIGVFHVTADDSFRLARLHGSTFQRPWTDGDVRALLKGPGGIGFVAQCDGIDAGFVIARALSYEAEVLSIGVLEKFRGRGLGQRLMTTLENELANRQAMSLFLEVDSTNARAVQLYRRSGFQRVGLRKHYYKAQGGRRTDAWVMRKHIEQPNDATNVRVESSTAGLG